MSESIPAIYQALVAVAADLAKEGIAKDRANVEQRFKFRGVDDVMNALGPLLAKHGVIVMPEVLSDQNSTRLTKSGATLHVVHVRVSYLFVAAADGSSHPVIITGEGMDMADKATAKALSAAYKYCMLQTFSVPVEGTPDADASGMPAEDWVAQGKALAGWVKEASTLAELVNLHNSARVQEFFQHAPEADVKRAKSVFTARKAQLSQAPAEEAAE